MFFNRKRIKISVMDTEAEESRLREIIEFLGVHGKQVQLNGSPKHYVITYHDSDIEEGLRKVKVSGNRILAANYALLIEGSLGRYGIKYNMRDVKIPQRKWI